MEILDSGAKVIDTYTKLIQSGHLISTPKPILIKENIKYKIQLDFSVNNIQIARYNGMKHEVKLTNGTTITFHRDPSSVHGIGNNAIRSLYFNEIKS